jgi:hypothetical protein
MDSEDIKIQEILSGIKNIPVKQDFAPEVLKRIESERVAREVLKEKREAMWFIIATAFGAAVIAGLFYYFNSEAINSFFADFSLGKTNLDRIIAIESVNLKSSWFEPFKNTFNGSNTLLWIVISVNTILLTLLGVYLEKRLKDLK